MSVNVFADFDITTLDCKITKRNSSLFPFNLSLRVDDKRKTMRLNLLPENSYRQSPNFNVLIYKTESVINEYTILLNLETLTLDYRWKYLGDNIGNEATYFCKVI
jgi:hypothetical protein